jgi:hypothetical protein
LRSSPPASDDALFERSTPGVDPDRNAFERAATVSN